MGDPDTIREAADGICESLKNAGKGVLDAQAIITLVTRLFGLIDESTKRTQSEEKTKKNRDQPDEDDEDDEEGDEDACRYSCQEAVGAIMEVEPEVMCQPEVMQSLIAQLGAFLASKENRTTGLYLFCNMLKGLKANAQPAFTIGMPAVFQALQDKDPDMRIPACWAINLASEIPQFAEAAPQSFKNVAALLSGKPPKKKDDQGWVAQDNAVAALLALSINQSQSCPPQVQPWDLILSKLPLEADWDEAKKVNKIIVDNVMAQNAGMLGPNASRLVFNVTAPAEIYTSEEYCEKE